MYAFNSGYTCEGCRMSTNLNLGLNPRRAKYHFCSTLLSNLCRELSPRHQYFWGSNESAYHPVTARCVHSYILMMDTVLLKGGRGFDGLPF